MSTIPTPVSQVLQARRDAAEQQINMQLLRKGLDAQKQTGDAINSLLQQSIQIQRQLANGHIDVRL